MCKNSFASCLACGGDNLLDNGMGSLMKLINWTHPGKALVNPR